MTEDIRSFTLSILPNRIPCAECSHLGMAAKVGMAARGKFPICKAPVILPIGARLENLDRDGKHYWDYHAGQSITKCPLFSPGTNEAQAWIANQRNAIRIAREEYEEERR